MVVVLDLQSRTRHSRRGDRGKSATYWRDRTSIWRSIPSSVAEGQIPGEYIGSVSASIAYAQKVLAEIAAGMGYRQSC